MSKSVNKNSNKNIINIKIGDSKKKRKSRKRKPKQGREGSYIINNISQQPPIIPQMNTPSYPPYPEIHPAVLHRNRPQQVDLTTQVDRENIGRRREEYFNNLFANPNQPASNDILNSSVDNDNDNDTVNLNNPFKKLQQNVVNSQMNKILNQNVDNYHNNKLLSSGLKALRENRDISKGEKKLKNLNENMLLRKAFDGFKQNQEINNRQNDNLDERNNQLMKYKALIKLDENKPIQQQRRMNTYKANEFYTDNLLQSALDKFKDNHQQKTLLEKVANDYDNNLKSDAILNWKYNTDTDKMNRVNQSDIINRADKYYNDKMRYKFLINLDKTAKENYQKRMERRKIHPNDTPDRKIVLTPAKEEKLLKKLGLPPMPKLHDKIDTKDLNDIFEKIDQHFATPDQSFFEDPNKVESPDIIPKFKKAYKIDDSEIQGDLMKYREIQDRKKRDFINRSIEHFKKPDYVKLNYEKDLNFILKKYTENRSLTMSQTKNADDYKILKKYAGVAGIEMRGSSFGYNSVTEKVNKVKDQLDADIKQLYPETRLKQEKRSPEQPNIVKKAASNKKLKPYQNKIQTIYTTNIG